MNLENFTKVCALFAKIDLYGSGPPAVPWRAHLVPTVDDIVKTVSSAANLLPRVYREGYADDVTHADPGLLNELADQITHVFGGPTHWTPTPTPSQLRALVWAYWIDQAAADIYGVLNAGPAFMMNLAAFFSALINRAAPSAPVPYLRSRSGADEAGDLDPHPTDILRLHLAIGVIETLRGLSSDVRARYIADLEQLSKLCAHGATEITLEGAIPFRDTTIRVRTTVPLTEWQEAAREVGQVTADTRMRALNGHGIQDIDTWDDVDEAHAQSIRQGLKENRSVVHFGNDAQLLSGAMLALLDDPDLYEAVTTRVNEALDESYRTDDVWGAVRRDRVYIGAPLVGEAPRAAGVGLAPVTSLGSGRRTAGARGAASRERR
jgi:hypothetical protein